MTDFNSTLLGRLTEYKKEREDAIGDIVSNEDVYERHQYFEGMVTGMEMIVSRAAHLLRHEFKNLQEKEAVAECSHSWKTCKGATYCTDCDAVK